MAEMRKHVVADTSFYICHACNLKRTDLLEKFLQSFQFHYGPIIDDEIPHLGKNDDKIRKQITHHPDNYAALFKPFSKRGKHLEEDGEYEAIGIAVELSMTGELDYLIIDDNGPKNFAKNKTMNILVKSDGCNVMTFKSIHRFALLYSAPKNSTHNSKNKFNA